MKKRFIFLAVILFLWSLLMMAQTAPLLYYDFDQSNPLAPAVGSGIITPSSGPTTVGGPATGIVGKYFSMPTNTYQQMSCGSVTVTNAATIQFWFRATREFAAGRNQLMYRWGLMSVSMQYPYLTFTTSVVGATQGSDFSVRFDGIGRKSWRWLTDGNWHHLAFVYNATTGAKSIWVDGQLPAGFTGSTAPGTINNLFGHQLLLNQVTDYVKFRGDIDEIALYNAVLDPRQIYQNYTESKAGAHYTTTFAASVPAAQSVTGILHAQDYAPGTNVGSVPVTTGVNVTPIQQLQSYPKPRYKPTTKLMRNWNGGDLDYEGQRFQSGVSDAQAAVNAANISLELAQNYYQGMGVGGGISYTSTTTIANAHPELPLDITVLRVQLGPSAIQNQGWTADKYLQNNSGGFVDGIGSSPPFGNFKLWRPTTIESFYQQDGITQKSFVQNIANTQLSRSAPYKINRAYDNAELYNTVSNYTFSLDPRCRDSLTVYGTDTQGWYGYRLARNENMAYWDIIKTATGCDSLYNTEYNFDGNDYGQSAGSFKTLPNRFKWSTARKVSKQLRGQYYSTMDIYMQRPELWQTYSQGVTVDGRGGLCHGWGWLQSCRPSELAVSDNLFSPFVSNGWYADETVNMRNAQYLGILKVMGPAGAEWYFNTQFSLGTPWPNAANWIWCIVAGSYAQAVTTKYEDIFLNGSLLVGDQPADYVNNTPGYLYYCNDARALVTIRKKNSVNKYAIAGMINPQTNQYDTLTLEQDVLITLAGSPLQFKVRGWGSVYVYDNTSPSAPVFYQVDGWHERWHYSWWSQDFRMKAVLYDTASSGVTMQTVRPNVTAGDFRNYTTSIRFAGVDSAEWNFHPNTVATNYLYVRARSVDGTSTGFNQRLDGAGLKTIDCITDTNWLWYRFNTADAVVISYGALSAANHTIRITSLNSKLSIEEVVISQTNNLFPSIAIPCGVPTATITPSGPTSFCSGGSVTLTANTANSYIWSTGATTQAIVVTTSGNYTVTITITGQGTATSSPTTVTVFPLPTATVTPSGATTFCSGNSITLTSNVNTAYIWSNAATTQSIVVSASGSYRVTVTDANGCTKSSALTAVTVTPGPTAVITAGGAITFCQGGSVLLSSTTGTGYTYQWKSGGINIPGATASGYSATTAGAYSVTVTVTGCTATSNTITVTVNALPTSVITAGGATTFCAGGSVTLTATANSFYLWSTGASTQAISATASGSYTVTVTGANGCTKSSAAVTVTVNPAPAASISAGGSTTFCTGGSVLISAVTGVGNAYQWRRNAGNIAGATNSSYSATLSGNYTAVVTLTGCSATSNTVSVTSVPNPTTANAGPDQSICTNTTIMNGNTPVNGTGTWTLISGSGTITTPSSPNTTITAIAAGANVFRWTIANAPCTASFDNVTITQTVSSPVSVIITADENPFCTGQTVNFLAVATNGGTPSYQWKLNGGNTGADQDTYSGTFTNGDQVTCVVASSLGCVTGNPATSNTITLTLSSVSAVISAAGPITFCNGGAVTLNANTGAGLTYEWHNGSGIIAGASSSSYATGTADTYFCIVTNSNGCFATSNSIVVTVNSNPTAAITPSGSTSFCTGGNVTLTATASTSYLWSTAATTQAIAVSVSGTFTVTVTNASGCTAVSSPVITTLSLSPVATITPSNDTTMCQGSITYNANTGAGRTYQWYKDGSIITGALTSSYAVAATGAYFFIVTNSAGCTKSSDTVNVLMSGPPTATITPAGSTTICTGDSLLLTSSPGNAYLWSTGKTTQSIYGKASGGYIVTVTGSNGCTASSASLIITISSPPLASITASGPTSFCLGGSVILTASANTSYLWSTGATTQTITVIATGTYTVTVGNATGCTKSSAGFAVTVNDCSNCTIPGNLTTTRIVWWSAQLNWDAYHVATNYIIELINMKTGKQVPTTWQGHTHAVIVNWPNIVANTGYKWRIQAVCGCCTFTPFSEWQYFSTPNIFNLGF